MSQRQQTSAQKLSEEQEMRDLSGSLAALDHFKARLKFRFAIFSFPPPLPSALSSASASPPKPEPGSFHVHRAGHSIQGGKTWGRGDGHREG